MPFPTYPNPFDPEGDPISPLAEDGESPVVRILVGPTSIDDIAAGLEMAFPGQDAGSFARQFLDHAIEGIDIASGCMALREAGHDAWDVQLGDLSKWTVDGAGWERVDG